MKDVYRFSIQAKDRGKKLISFLFEQKELSLPSLKKARRLLEEGRCSVNGVVRTFASTVVYEGDRIEVLFKETIEAALHTVPGLNDVPKVTDQTLLKMAKSVPSSAKVSIIYEDPYLFVIDKTPDVVCDPKTIETVTQRPTFLAHRLDKETTGLLLCASQEAYAQTLQDLFRQKKIEKKYLAIVDGRVLPARGVVSSSLIRRGHVGDAVFFKTCSSGGRSAVTSYAVLCATEEASLVALVPKTGRTHQLRVHMASIGHPILGDYQYGSRFVGHLRPKRHLLHAFKISFLHPFESFSKNSSKLILRAPLPNDFIQYMNFLFPKYLFTEDA